MIIVEPRCTGKSHATFNAAFLVSTFIAFNGSKLTFIAEESHISAVKEVLNNDYGKEISIEYVFINLPNTNLNENDFSRMPYEEKTIPFVFDYADNANIDKIIFTYSTTPQIFLSRELLKQYENIECYSILHEVSAAIQEKSLSQYIKLFQRNPRSFVLGHIRNLQNKIKGQDIKSVILNSNIERFTYIVLGESIKRATLKKYPELAQFLESIDHPYLYKSEVQYIPFQNKKIQLGIFGFLQNEKGYSVIKKLIKDFKNTELDDLYEIKVIGTMKPRKQFAKYIIPASTSGMISREKFDELSQNIDYVLFLYPPQFYKYRASGSFFDSLSYVKPFIALNSDFISYYAQKLGNIGYICSNYNEIKEKLKNIILEKPTKEYLVQQENLRKAREILSIEANAESVRNIFN